MQDLYTHVGDTYAALMEGGDESIWSKGPASPVPGAQPCTPGLHGRCRRRRAYRGHRPQARAGRVPCRSHATYAALGGRASFHSEGAGSWCVVLAFSSHGLKTSTEWEVVPVVKGGGSRSLSPSRPPWGLQQFPPQPGPICQADSGCSQGAGLGRAEDTGLWGLHTCSERPLHGCFPRPV